MGGKVVLWQRDSKRFGELPPLCLFWCFLEERKRNVKGVEQSELVFKDHFVLSLFSFDKGRLHSSFLDFIDFFGMG